MCLLKRERKDTNCGHEECKNFYMLNQQMCYLNYNKPQIALEVPSNVNPLLLAQTQQQQFGKPVFATTISVPSNTNANRAAKQVENTDSDDNDYGMLNKKKLKVDDSLVSEPTQSSMLANYNLSDLALLSQQSANNSNNVMNAQFWNNIARNNNQNAPQGNENMGLLSQYNDLFSSMLQNNQQNNMLNKQPAAFNINQIYSQNINKPGNNLSMIGGAQNTDDNKGILENQASVEAFMKDFQAKTFNMLFMQSRLLNEIKEKNETLQGSMACLINEVSNLKGLVTQINHDKPTPTANNPMIIHQIIGNSTETGTSDSLITYLYGPKPEFEYYLVFKNELPLPLYRERNFKFTVKLVDAKGKLIENSNRIPLTIGIYSSENPPKYIDANTAGNKILKGFIDKDLVNGTATFEKIQIKEVTSHFRNGWIFFVVYPKMSKSSNTSMFYGGNGLVVDSQKVKPLILEKVIVKAKKTKEKDQEESPNSGDYGNDTGRDDVNE